MFGDLGPVGVGALAVIASGCLAAGVVGAIARNREETPGARPFAGFAFAVAGWNAALALQMVSPFDTASLFYRVQTTLSLFAVFFWVVFAIHYSGNGDWLTRRRLGLLWAEPLAYALLTVTNGWHGLLPVPEPATVAGLTLFYPAINGLVVFQLAYTYALALASFVLIGSFAVRTRAGHRKQAVLLLTGAIAVTLSNALYFVLGLSPHPAFDPASVAMAGMAIVVAVVLFRYDFLSVSPLAADMIVDEMIDPVLVLDQGRRIIETNEPARQLIGAADDEPVDLTRALPELAAAIEQLDTTVTITTDGGETRTYDVNVSPVHDYYDRPQGTLLVLRDITVEKRRQQRLEQKNEQLERFAQVVSHDLRNPLSVASGHAEMALETGDMTHVERSLESMRDMDALIDDLLTLALEGRAVDDPEWVDFESAVRSAGEFVADDADITVDSTGDIQADPDRLEELLENLFRNAVEHAGTGVSVHVGVTDDGFYVEDDGPGIPAEERGTIFESGYTTSEHGTGLGLSIVSTIAEAHGWSVAVAEGSEGGARFVVSGAERRDSPADDPGRSATRREERLS